MAITSVGAFGSDFRGTGQMVRFDALSTAVAGDLIIVAIAKENLGTADGETTEVAGIEDDSGVNVWRRAGEYCNTVGGTAKDGAVAAIWYSLLDASIASGSVITVNFASGTNVKSAATAWRFTTAGTGIAVITPVTTAATTGSAPSMSISSLANREYLFVRAEAAEENVVGTFTVSSNYTKLTAATAGGSPAVDSIAINGEFRITTTTTTTSNPSGTTAGIDRASLLIAFYEGASGFPGAMMWTF